MMKLLEIVGLALTLVGAAVLSWRDLKGERLTWAKLGSQSEDRRRAAIVGFPLIVVGSALQILAVAIS